MKMLLAAIIPFLVFACTNSNSNKTETEKPIETSTNNNSMSIDGAWELIWAKHNDTIQDISRSAMFKMFHDGVFSLIARNSAGKINFAGFGDYELSGNTYKEIFRYHTHTPYTGAMDWQTYELNGDTLYFKGFDKVVVNGKDVSKGWLRIEEKRVRVKW
jgi:hypothetical protein